MRCGAVKQQRNVQYTQSYTDEGWDRQQRQFESLLFAVAPTPLTGSSLTSLSSLLTPNTTFLLSQMLISPKDDRAGSGIVHQTFLPPVPIHNALRLIKTNDSCICVFVVPTFLKLALKWLFFFFFNGNNTK